MLSRRNFINTTLAAGAALATQGRNAMAQSKRMIVDAQAHLWKAESEDWKWVPGRKPQLPEPFTIEKLVPLMDEAGVDRVVIVPPSWPGDRNDYAIEAAKRYPDRFAIMGRIPLQNPKSADAAAEVEGAAGHEGHPADLPCASRRRLLGHADWIFPRGREGRPAGHVLRPGQHAEVRADRRAPSGADADHRPHGPDRGDRARKARSRRPSTRRSSSRNIPTFGQGVVGAELSRRRPIRSAT